MPEEPPKDARLLVAILGAVGVIGALVFLRPGQDRSADSHETRTQNTLPPPAPPERPREPPIGDYFFLIDVSGSVRPREDERRLGESLTLLRQAISAFGTMEEVLPARVRVAVIGDLGLDQRAACEVYLARPTVFTPPDTTGRAWHISACTDTLLAMSPAKHTDIRGALKFAGAALRGTTPKLRGVVVVSDLVEDLAPGREPATPELGQVCVVTYVQPNPEMARRPDSLDARILEWERELMRWGSPITRVDLIGAFTPEDLVAFFRSCEGTGGR
jgi:hypothetical protein